MKISSVSNNAFNNKTIQPNFKAIVVDDEIWHYACPIHRGSKPAKDFRKQMQALAQENPDIDCFITAKNNLSPSQIEVTIKYTSQAQNELKQSVLSRLKIKPGFFQQISQNKHLIKTIGGASTYSSDQIFTEVREDREAIVNGAFAQGIANMIDAHRQRVPDLSKARGNADVFQALKTANAKTNEAFESAVRQLYKNINGVTFAKIKNNLKDAPIDLKQTIFSKYSQNAANYYQENISPEELDDYLTWVDKEYAGRLLYSKSSNKARFMLAIAKTSPEEQRAWRDALLGAEAATLRDKNINILLPPNL